MQDPKMGEKENKPIPGGINLENTRKLPIDTPTEFIKPRWAKLVLTNENIDRRHYELCVLSGQTL
jgi:hypothetical protein